MVECSFMKYVIVSSNLIAVTKTWHIAPVLSKEFLDIQAAVECRFPLKRVCDMIIPHSLSYYLSLKISRIPHHLNDNMILYITFFAVLKTVIKITSVKVQDG